MAKGATFRGIDHQIDTYFNSNCGRLKLREGKIENNLIFYERENTKLPRQSDYILYNPTNSNYSLKEILEKSLGVFVVVDKQREIYHIDNIKFHIDIVKDLGTFIEIEVMDNEGNIGQEKLLEQCNYYLRLFNVLEDDLISGSYSDLIFLQM